MPDAGSSIPTSYIIFARQVAFTGCLPFSGDPQIPYAATLVREISNGEFAQFLATESMVEQGG